MNKRLTKVRSLAQSGRLAEAAELAARVCKKDPSNAEAWFMRGTLLGNAGRFGEAANCLRQAVKLQPENALGYFNLGNTLAASGQLGDATVAYETAQRLAPGRAEIARTLARVEGKQGHPAKAIDQYQRYLKVHPGDADALGNLGGCYFHLGELESAATSYREALKRQRAAGWMDSLAATLCHQGKISEALEAHREAVQLCPEETRYHSNLLLSLNYLPDISAQELLKEHEFWHLLDPVTPPDRTCEFCNTPDTGRRLRIGYVSPDFRTHSVAYFLEPLFGNHDEVQVETYAYACSPHRDGTTERLRATVHHWREIASLDDPAAFARIQDDAIDILVDLSGHTAGNRLPLFRMKPAPVQITYLGYPATTGLESMDYRLTDELADPPGYEAHYNEELIRIPSCFLCYTAPARSPPVARDAADIRNVTFGSFNNQAKINAGVIALWSRLLHATPGSRLLLKNPSLSDTVTANLCRARFAEHGIGAERLELMGLAATTEAHLDTYRRVDIALDTFPYNGTTTTCEALWMGVPVVALAGHIHAGRVGLSLLTAVGLNDMVGMDPEDYLAKATALAENPARLTELRQILRDTMSASLLCDGAAFARKIEAAYRDAWKRWCSGIHIYSSQ